MLLLHEKSEAGHVELYQAGKKWGVKIDGKVIVPPLYHRIAQPVGAYCAFEQIPQHGGIMTSHAKEASLLLPFPSFTTSPHDNISCQGEVMV